MTTTTTTTESSKDVGEHPQDQQQQPQQQHPLDSDFQPINDLSYSGILVDMTDEEKEEIAKRCIADGFQHQVAQHSGRKVVAKGVIIPLRISSS